MLRLRRSLPIVGYVVLWHMAVLSLVPMGYMLASSHQGNPTVIVCPPDGWEDYFRAHQHGVEDDDGKCYFAVHSAPVSISSEMAPSLSFDWRRVDRIAVRQPVLSARCNVGFSARAPPFPL